MTEGSLALSNIDGLVSIVMPAFNEGERIYNNLLKTVDIVSGFADKFEIVAVNDGSRDNTKAEIERAASEDSRIRLVSSENNHGKGSAILAGVAESRGSYIAFVDADLELDPSQLEGYLDEIVNTGCDVVIASKLHPKSELKYPLKRRIISFGYYLMLRTLFRLKLRDTQTGLKVFKSEAIKPIAHLIRTSGFAYDIEILVAASRRGYVIHEMPVKVVYIRERNDRRIKFDDIWKAFKDTWAIFYRAYFRNYYN